MMNNNGNTDTIQFILYVKSSKKNISYIRRYILVYNRNFVILQS